MLTRGDEKMLGSLGVYVTATCPSVRER